MTSHNAPRQSPSVNRAARNVAIALGVLAAVAVTLAFALRQSPVEPVSAASATPVASVVKTVPCKVRMSAWIKATANVQAADKRALAPFSSPSAMVTNAEGAELATASQAAENAPPPRCADPKGYYGAALAELTTAGSSASSGGGILAAVTPMENAETDLSMLDAELVSTVGSSKL
jgi:hypothetical protein